MRLGLRKIDLLRNDPYYNNRLCHRIVCMCVRVCVCTFILTTIRVSCNNHLVQRAPLFRMIPIARVHTCDTISAHRCSMCRTRGPRVLQGAASRNSIHAARPETAYPYMPCTGIIMSKLILGS